MKILKIILIGNFWSFLLTLSGIIDFIIGFLVLINVIHVTDHSFMTAIICFVVGFIYFTGGITIAFVRMIKERNKKEPPVSGKSDK